jgi:hypothetical protein
MERGRFCFAAWRYATTLWLLLTGPENAWPSTLTADRLSRTLNSWHASIFTLDINLSDGKTHRISLYAYDSFHTGKILPSKLRTVAQSSHRRTCPAFLMASTKYGRSAATLLLWSEAPHRQYRQLSKGSFSIRPYR